MDEPIANSSMLVLPRTTAPASRRRSVMWASYGARYPSRIREPAVHCPPLSDTRSLSATGTPWSGWSAAIACAPSARAAASRASAASASASARSSSIVSHAWRPRSVAWARARCAAASSREVDLAGPEAISHLVGEQLSSRSGPACRPRRSLPAQNGRHDEEVAVPVGRVGQHVLGRQRRARNVVAQDVLQLDRLGGRRDRVRVELGQLRVLVEDVVELALEPGELAPR